MHTPLTVHAYSYHPHTQAYSKAAHNYVLTLITTVIFIFYTMYLMFSLTTSIMHSGLPYDVKRAERAKPRPQ